MNALRTKLITHALAGLLMLSAVARADQIDDAVAAEMKRQQIPGASVAIVKDGKPVKVAGYGMANVELGHAATPQTVFQIASLSKQLIAAGVLLLVQDGKFGLDERMGRFLTDAPEAWRNITVRQLLTHTSGLINEPPGFNMSVVQSDAEVIRSAYSSPLLFEPGSKWQYSNTGYYVLAEIIRIASAEPWSEFLRQRLFQPLGMNATRTTTATGIVPNRADGYSRSDNTLQNALRDGALLVAVRPSGAFLSSASDMALWTAALQSGSLFTAAIREQVWSPVALKDGSTHGYGFGWHLDTVGNHRRAQHSGTLPGFRAAIHHWLDDGLTVVVLTNLERADPGAIGRAVAATFMPDLASQTAVALSER